MVIGMPEAIDMGVDMGLVPVSHLGPRSMGVLNRVVLCLKRVRQDSDLLIPDRSQDLIVSPELVDADDLAPDLSALRMMDQHAVTEKFPADRGPCRVDGAGKPLAFWVLSHERAAFLRCGGFPASFLEFFFDLVSELVLHMHLEEFVSDTIPTEIISFSYLPLDPDELPKTRTTFPAPVAIEFYHTNLRSHTG